MFAGLRLALGEDRAGGRLPDGPWASTGSNLASDRELGSGARLALPGVLQGCAAHGKEGGRQHHGNRAMVCGGQRRRNECEMYTLSGSWNSFSHLASMRRTLV